MLVSTVIDKLPNRKNFIDGKNTVEIGYPWLTVDSIIFLESVLRKNFNVFECGCGGSTVFYSNNCLSVFALETDEIWANKVKNLNLNNVDVKHLKNTEEFVEIIKQLPNNFYDVISIDSDPKKTNRLVLTKHAIPKIKRFGFLILDNYNAFGTEKFLKPENCIEYTFDDPNWAGKGTKIFQLK